MGQIRTSPVWYCHRGAASTCWILSWMGHILDCAGSSLRIAFHLTFPASFCFLFFFGSEISGTNYLIRAYDANTICTAHFATSVYTETWKICVNDANMFHLWLGISTLIPFVFKRRQFTKELTGRRWAWAFPPRKARAHRSSSSLVWRSVISLIEPFDTNLSFVRIGNLAEQPIFNAYLVRNFFKFYSDHMALNILFKLTSFIVILALFL